MKAQPERLRTSQNPSAQCSRARTFMATLQDLEGNKSLQGRILCIALAQAWKFTNFILFHPY